ncbi:hypothetical protein [Nostoc sp.]
MTKLKDEENTYRIRVGEYRVFMKYIGIRFDF